MRGLVKKWENSAAVRIPASVLVAAQVRLDQPVDVREEGGRIVIKPMRPHRYDIDSLVADITDENLHQAIDMGKPADQEIQGAELRLTKSRHGRPCAGQPRRSDGSALENWPAHAFFSIWNAAPVGVGGRHKAGQDGLKTTDMAFAGLLTRVLCPVGRSGEGSRLRSGRWRRCVASLRPAGRA